MSEILTLLIAWRLAHNEGRDEAKAIRRCATKLAPKTQDKKVKKLLNTLKDKKHSDFKVIESVKGMYINMKYSDLL